MSLYHWEDRKWVSYNQVASYCKVYDGLQFIYWTLFCSQAVSSYIFAPYVFIIVSLP